MPLGGFPLGRVKCMRRGFTLIELLVVIAIIAILAAILFPVFAQMKDRARRTACTSNLRQLYLAFYQYADDNGGLFPCYLPGGWKGLNEGWLGGPWPKQLWDYYKNAEIIRCPSDNGGVGGSRAWWSQTSVHAENKGGTSYCYQPYLGGKDPLTAPVGRTWYDYGCPSPGYDRQNRQILADGTAYHQGRGEHWASTKAGFNTLMTDGHVKFYTNWYKFAYTWW